MGKFGQKQIQMDRMHKLFVYGTLQFPEILQKITGKLFVAKPASLNDFKRYKVKNAEYPAIVPKPGAITHGFILENVDEASLKAIDFFEGYSYKKIEVTVLVSTKKVTAYTYVWNSGENSLSEKDWDKKDFEKNYLKYYI